MDTYALLLVFLCSCGTSESARILGVFPIGGISHYAPAEAILKALAAHGHNITVITSYPQKTPVANFRDIDISRLKGVAINSLSYNLVRTVLQSFRNNFNFIGNVSRTYCRLANSLPETRALLDEKFDLVISEIFGSDCNVGFAWHNKAPLISVSSSRPLPWAYSRVGSPVNPAYKRQVHVAYPMPMGFVQRLQNTWYYLYYRVFYAYSHNGPVTEAISRDFFGPDVPPVKDIVRNTSLVFVNSHFTIDDATPVTPNFIEIAGIHIKPAKPLPQDIQKFMDDAKQGVIYFTLGSLVRTSTLPKQVIKAFRDSFAELPVKVMWKFELELENTPENVFISKWFPQSDILAHPNLKAYITHGGQLGILEALHNGLPLVGIPLFYDQHGNIQGLVDKGAAIRLSFDDLTKETISAALKAVLFDERYSKNMKELSKRFKDRPMTPQQTAVYWVDYVLRHNGAHHLKPSSLNMPWYQYFLIDVIAFVIVIFISAIVAIRYSLKALVTHSKRLISKNKTD